MGEALSMVPPESQMPAEDFSNMSLESLWAEHEAYMTVVLNSWGNKELLDRAVDRYTAVVTANGASMDPLADLIATRSGQVIHDLPKSGNS